MTPKTKSPQALFKPDPPLFQLKDLTARVLDSSEYDREGKLLDKEHYLGDLRASRSLLAS